jgi:hypothetical protein
MQATRPDVEVPGDNEQDLNIQQPLPVYIRARTMARSGECLGMSEYSAVWRFGYRHGSERHTQTSIKMDNAFLWVLADRKSGEVVDKFEGAAINLPERFRNVLEWGN